MTEDRGRSECSAGACSLGTNKLTATIKQTKIGGTIVQNSWPTLSRSLGPEALTGDLPERGAMGSASRTKTWAIVRRQIENSRPLAVIPARRCPSLLKRGMMEGVPMVSATLRKDFVPDFRITATSVQKTSLSINPRNSLTELSLTVFSRVAGSPILSLSS